MKQTLEEQLKQLQSEIVKIESILISQRENEERLKNKIELPRLIKKYEGKYFKYKNSYGRDDSWNLYSYCEKVAGGERAIVHQFQTDIRGKCEFEIGNTHFHLFQTEITKAEYLRALKQFKARCNKL